MATNDHSWLVSKLRYFIVPMKQISNWGNTPTIQAPLIPFHQLRQLKEILCHAPSVIARGMGRCYGDSALSDTIVSTTDFNQIISFDASAGVLICQSGLTLNAILSTIVPAGWFLPVTPGTKFVTMGGAVAANVHGKNHHLHGSISQHIIYIDVLTSDGNTRRCSADEQSDLFYMTCGGMGLTGIIVEVAIKLIPISSSYIRQKTMRANNLDTIMDYFESHHDWTYSVAWIDCLAKGSSLGRSLYSCLANMQHVMNCHDVNRNDRFTFVLNEKKAFLFSCLTGHSIHGRYGYLIWRTLTQVHNQIQLKLLTMTPFFIPWIIFIIGISAMERAASPSINVCFHCNHKDGLTQLLQKISASGQGSFLAVLKRFGKESLPGLSFPMEGYTLALDFPMTTKSCQLMNDLDTIVERYNGRLYLAKDSRMSASFFKSTHQHLESFCSFKHQIDANHQFESLQSNRLGL